MATFDGTVQAEYETGTVMGSGDVADDPAIRVAADPSESLIVGTGKATSGGLVVWNLQGREVSRLATGTKLNNVDIVQGYQFNGETIDLLAASNRNGHSIDFFKMDAAGKITFISRIAAGIEPYGLDIDVVNGKLYAFATAYDEGNGETSVVRQFDVKPGGSNLIGTLVREISIATGAEGLAVDVAQNALYVAEEAGGFYRYSADPASGNARTQIDRIGSNGLVADLEGVTIYDGPGDRDYVLLSSQGNSTFKVYDRYSNAFMGTFKVEGVQDTDGIDVSSADMGGAFSNGVFVAHDAFTGETTSNFKIVPWTDIQALIDTAFPGTTEPQLPTGVSTFQQGLGGYVGTVDTYLDGAAPAQTRGLSGNVNVDGSTKAGFVQHGLLRFDGLFGATAGQIPTGATILKATLDLGTTNGSADAASLHRLLSGFSNASTWANAFGGDGVQANGREALATADVVVRGTQVGSSLIDVTKSLQAWSDGAANHGWAILPNSGDGWDFVSSTGANAPKLTVEWVI